MAPNPSFSVRRGYAVMSGRRSSLRILLTVLAIGAISLGGVPPGRTTAAQHLASDQAMRPPDRPARASSSASAIGPSAVDPTMPLVTFLHVARTGSSGNTSGHITTIDHPATNGKPDVLLFVTPNWNPGDVGGTYHNRPIGVWYDSFANKWTIYNDDRGTMGDGTAFNVMVYPASAPNVFTHSTTSSNTSGDTTCLDHPLTNNRPDVLLFITHKFGNYNPHPTHVAYSAGRWCIRNSDGAGMTVGTRFNVLVLEPGAQAFVHRATADNTAFNETVINNPLTDGKRYRFVFITPTFNPGGGGGTNNPHYTGIYYAAEKFRIFNQDLASMPVGAAFNVFVPVSESGAFVHQAMTDNILYNYTIINNSLFNSNPFAILFVTPNWNPGGSSTGVYNNHPIGVWYSDGTWRVFNQDIVNMPNGAAFNVLMPEQGINVFLHKATSTNSSGNYTIIDHPLTNGNPNALLLVTPNWNPGGSSSGVYNNHPIGVWYTGSRWSIFNQDLATMPTGAWFNVMVLPAEPAAFLHRATSSNTVNNFTRIDHPLTNGKRSALVFTTPNWNPPGSGGVYNNSNIGVWYDIETNKWSIFNQNTSYNMPINAAFNVYVVSNNVYLPMISR